MDTTETAGPSSAEQKYLTVRQAAFISFGSYAASTFAGENQAWTKFFAAAIIIVMTGVNIVGSRLVAGAQTVIAYVVLGILSVFAVVTLVNITPARSR